MKTKTKAKVFLFFCDWFFCFYSRRDTCNTLSTSATTQTWLSAMRAHYSVQLLRITYVLVDCVRLAPARGGGEALALEYEPRWNRIKAVSQIFDFATTSGAASRLPRVLPESLLPLLLCTRRTCLCNSSTIHLQKTYVASVHKSNLQTRRYACRRPMRRKTSAYLTC